MLLVKLWQSPQVIQRVEDKSDAKQLHDLVGGYIEMIPFKETIVFGGRRYVGGFCDEEGKLKGKEVNIVANILWAESWQVGLHQMQDVLVGDVVFFEEGEVE